jgi:N-acetyl sugar amidotransferase
MDTTDKEIVFDKDGVCNHCHDFDEKIKNYRFSEQEEKNNIENIAKEIKQRAGNSEYDCLIGLSGGVDSSYVAYLVKNMDLNPLVVHFDNGWNSDIAVSNIKKIVDQCGWELTTYVINWNEFKDLQKSFFKASVVDIEMLTDHAISATIYRLAKRYKIKSIMRGVNFTTEHGMPTSWLWDKSDFTNIKDIHDKFGQVPIKTFPVMTKIQKFFFLSFNKFYDIPILNMINYDKNKAMKVLKEEFDWQYYGGKHYESVFTKFYQAYILPTKFNIDKRKNHLSCLIRNGEIFRDEAIKELSNPLYEEKELRIDKDYVLKKLGFSKEEFDGIMSEDPKSHDEYKIDANSFIRRTYRKLKRFIG